MTFSTNKGDVLYTTLIEKPKDKGMCELYA